MDSGPKGDGPCRLLVVEDDDFTRVTLASALAHHGIDVVAAVADAREALVAFGRHTIDVVLVDLDLGPGPTGLDVAVGLRRERPDLGIVILTTYEDPRLLSTSLRNLPERSHYVVKQSLSELGILVAAIQSAGDPGGPTVTAPELLDLSDAQIETLRLLACGLTNAEIARIRVIEEKSVEQAVSRIARRLGLDSSHNRRVALARAYYEFSGSHLPSATKVRR